MLYTLYTY